MYSRSELKKYLQEISTEAKFVRFEFASSEKFEIEIKCKIEGDQSPEFYGQYAGDWIKKFSKFTATTWIVRTCFPKLKRLVYRKVFVCHRSSFNKKKKPDYESRNQACEAKVEFRTKFINRNTIKNDCFLKDGLNLTISIDFTHSHKVRAPESFNLLKSMPDTDDTFLKYFESGCGATAAKSYHELTLLKRYGEQNTEVFLNANINPSLRHVLYLHGKRRKEFIEAPSYESIMASKKAVYEKQGGTINYTDNPQIIVIITPVMKRTITEIGLEKILIDSTAVPNGPACTFFYVPTDVGALPVTCVIHKEQTTENYFHAFIAVKMFLETEIDGPVEPEVLVLSDYKEQKTGVSSLWPRSKLLSSRLTICNDMWRWMNEDESRVGKKRHQIMVQLKAMLSVGNMEQAHAIYTEQREMEYMEFKMIENWDNIWKTSNEWFTDDPKLCNNLVEASIRLLKEVIFRRLKFFNNRLLVDFITNIYEDHQRRIILSHVKNCDIVQTYTTYLSKSTIVLETGPLLRQAGCEYRIACYPKPRKYLYFRVDTMYCDCVFGRKAQFCDHLTAIMNLTGTDMMKAPTLTEEGKELFFKIAGGDVDEYETIKPDAVMESEHNREDKGDEGTEDSQVDEEENDSRDQLEYPNEDGHMEYLFQVEIKKERLDSDPLEAPQAEQIEQNNDIEFPMAENENEVPSVGTDMKRKYEVALVALNDEFRRLNKFFSQNPNSSNLETMRRLARELSKIRPVERVNLSNMDIKINRRNCDGL